MRFEMIPGIGGELLDDWAGRPAGKTTHPDQGVVAAPTRRQFGLTGEFDQPDGAAIGQAEPVEAAKEAELDTTTDQSLVDQGRNTTSPIPACIRQKMEPLKSNSIRLASWSPSPAAKRGLARSPPS